MSDTSASFPPIDPTPAADSTPTPVVVSTKDRLKAIRVRSEVVDVSDTDEPLLLRVSGLDTVSAIALSGDGSDPEAVPDPLTINPQMLRLMVTDPVSGENVYADWTDDEINRQPMSVTNTIMMAANRVLGRDGAPGKGLPSTTGGGSSS